MWLFSYALLVGWHLHRKRSLRVGGSCWKTNRVKKQRFPIRSDVWPRSVDNRCKYGPQGTFFILGQSPSAKKYQLLRHNVCTFIVQLIQCPSASVWNLRGNVCIYFYHPEMRVETFRFIGRLYKLFSPRIVGFQVPWVIKCSFFMVPCRGSFVMSLS